MERLDCTHLGMKFLDFFFFFQTRFIYLKVTHTAQPPKDPFNSLADISPCL